MKYANFFIIFLAVVILSLVISACGLSNGCAELAIDEQEESIGFDQQLAITEVSKDPQIEICGIEFDGQQRRYMMFVPKNYSRNNSYPLVIYLHSYDFTAIDGMNYTLLNKVAEENEFLIVYPSAKPNWNSGTDNPGWPTPDHDDVGFIRTLLDTLINRYNIDQNRIYSTGFSNGGHMAHKLGCQLSDRIAAIASVAGRLPTDTAVACNPSHPMPVLYIHGTDDTFANIEGGHKMYSAEQTFDFWSEYNNCSKTDKITLPDIDPGDGSTIEKYMDTNCDNNSVVIFYKVINGGHSWPGVYSPSWAVNTNQDLNASEEIWNFFKDHQLASTSN